MEKVIITLHAQEIKKDKQVFIACSTEINGKWFKVKFTKECNDIPKTRGLYDMTVDLYKCSIENGKPYTSNGKKGVSNDIIWVRQIVDIKKYTEEELQENSVATLKNLFKN